MSGRFGLYVRHTLKDGAAETFDRLVAATTEGVRRNEPGTLVYVSHVVEGQPNLRVFYELYRDREAFDEHERQEHTQHFLAEREALVDEIEVDWLTAPVGKSPQ
jgi:quinol monooxygenase YgiN